MNDASSLRRNVLESRVGVLLVNLGSPDEASPAALRRYLHQFLSDPRVIEDQGLIWKFVLNAIILTTRPRRRARDYAKIWNTAENEAPLKTITRGQAQKLAAALTGSGTNVNVDWAMRYGNPAIAELSWPHWLPKAANACWSCRSIRNTPRPRQLRSRMKFSACWVGCARNPHCGLQRPTTTTLSTLAHLQHRSERRWSSLRSNPK
jgi:hypothetical protein